MTAYDYERQEWVTGPAAVSILRKQIEDELAMVLSPRGKLYVESCLSTHDYRNGPQVEPRHVVPTVEAVAARLRADLATLGGSK